MQLGKTETFGAFDDHHGSVRHVHTNLYHGRRHQYLRLAGNKLLHFRLFVGRFHLSVNHTYLIFRENFFECLEPLFQVLIIQLLTAFDQRINDIDLPALSDFLTEKVVKLRFLVIIAVHGLDRFASGWQLINHRDIQITV